MSRKRVQALQPSLAFSRHRHNDAPSGSRQALRSRSVLKVHAAASYATVQDRARRSSREEEARRGARVLLISLALAPPPRLVAPASYCSAQARNRKCSTRWQRFQVASSRGARTRTARTRPEPRMATFCKVGLSLFVSPPVISSTSTIGARLRRRRNWDTLCLGGRCSRHPLPSSPWSL